MSISSEEIKSQLDATSADRPYTTADERAAPLRGLVGLGGSSRTDQRQQQIGEQGGPPNPGAMTTSSLAPTDQQPPGSDIPISQPDRPGGPPNPQDPMTDSGPFAPGAPLRGVTDAIGGLFDKLMDVPTAATVAANWSVGHLTGNNPVLADRYGQYTKQGDTPWDAMTKVRQDIEKTFDVAINSNDPTVADTTTKALAWTGRVGDFTAQMINPAFGGLGLGAAARGARAAMEAVPVVRGAAPAVEAIVRTGGLAPVEWAAKTALRGVGTGLREAANASTLLRSAAATASSAPVRTTLGAIASGIDGLEGLTVADMAVGRGLAGGASLARWLATDAPLAALKLQRGLALDNAQGAIRQALRQTKTDMNTLASQMLDERRPIESLDIWPNIPKSQQAATKDILEAMRNADPWVKGQFQRDLLHSPDQVGENAMRNTLSSLMQESADRLGIRTSSEASATSIQRAAMWQAKQGITSAQRMAVEAPSSGVVKSINDIWYGMVLTSTGYPVHVALSTMARAMAVTRNPLFFLAKAGEAEKTWFTEVFPEHAGVKGLDTINPFAGAGWALRRPTSAAFLPKGVWGAVRAVRDNMEAKTTYELARPMMRDALRSQPAELGRMAPDLTRTLTRLDQIVPPESPLSRELHDAVLSGHDAVVQARKRVIDGGSLAYLAGLRRPSDIVQVMPDAISAKVEQGLEDIFTRGGDERAIIAHFDQMASNSAIDPELRKIEQEYESIARRQVRSVIDQAEKDPAFAATHQATVDIARDAESVTAESEYTSARAEEQRRLRESGADWVTQRGVDINEGIADHADAMRQRVFQLTMAQIQRVEKMGPSAAQDATHLWMNVTRRTRDSALAARTRRDALLDATLKATKLKGSERRAALLDMIQGRVTDAEGNSRSIHLDDVKRLGTETSAIDSVTNGLLWDNYFKRSNAIWDDHFARSLTEMDSAVVGARVDAGVRAPTTAEAATSAETAKPVMAETAQRTVKTGPQRPPSEADLAEAKRAAAAGEIPAEPKQPLGRRIMANSPEQKAAEARVVTPAQQAAADQLHAAFLERALGPTRAQMRTAVRQEMYAWRDRALEVARGGPAREKMDSTAAQIASALTDAADAYRSASAAETRAHAEMMNRVRDQVRAERDAAFVNYSQMTNADRVMKSVFPFWMFASRNPASWGHILVQRPQLAAAYMQTKEDPQSTYIPVGNTGYRINPLAPMSLLRFVRGPYTDPTTSPVQQAVTFMESMGLTPGLYASGALMAANEVSKQAGGPDIANQQQYPIVPGGGAPRAITAAMGMNQGQGIDIPGVTDASQRGPKGASDPTGLRMDQLAARLAASSGEKTAWDQLSPDQQAHWRSEAYKRQLLTLASNAFSYQDPGYRAYIDDRKKTAQSLGVTEEDIKALSQQGLDPLSSPKVMDKDRAAFYAKYPQYGNIPSSRPGPAGDDLRIATDYFAKSDHVWQQVKDGYTDVSGNAHPGLAQADKWLQAGKTDDGRPFTRTEWKKVRDDLYNYAVLNSQTYQQQALALSSTAPVNADARSKFRQKYGEAEPSLDPMKQALNDYRAVQPQPNGTGGLDWTGYTQRRISVLADLSKRYGPDFAQSVVDEATSQKTDVEKRVDWTSNLAAAYAVHSPDTALAYAKSLDDLDHQYKVIDELRVAGVSSRDRRITAAYNAIRADKNAMTSPVQMNGQQVNGYEDAQWQSLFPQEQLDTILRLVTLPRQYQTSFQRKLMASLTPANRVLALQMAAQRKAAAGKDIEEP